MTRCVKLSKKQKEELWSLDPARILAAVESLLSAGREPADTVEGMTLFNWAVYGHDPALIRQLLDSHGETLSDANRSQAIHSAAARGCVAVVKALLDAGTSANAEFAHLDVGKGHVMHTAAHTGKLEVLKLLSDQGGDPNAAGSGTLTTPLMESVRKGHAKCVEFLLSIGASAQPDSHDKALLVEFADSQERTDIALLLLNAIANQLRLTVGAPPGVPVLHAASFLGSTRSIKHLVDGGTEVDERDLAGNTALLVGVRGHQLRVVSQLLCSGADPNVSNAEGQNALFLALAAGDRELVRTLLTSGADPNRALASASTMDEHPRLWELVRKAAAGASVEDMVRDDRQEEQREKAATREQHTTATIGEVLGNWSEVRIVGACSFVTFLILRGCESIEVHPDLSQNPVYAFLVSHPFVGAVGVFAIVSWLRTGRLARLRSEAWEKTGDKKETEQDTGAEAKKKSEQNIIEQWVEKRVEKILERDRKRTTRPFTRRTRRYLRQRRRRE